MSDPTNHSATAKRLLQLLAVALSAVISSEILLNWWSQQQRQEAVLAALNTANQTRSILESELNAAASLASGVSIYVSALQGEVEPDGLQQMLQSAYERGSYFRNIGLAPDNVISYIYPQAGNEPALGVDYRTLPEQWSVIQDIIATGEGRLAGPLPLVQGGIGLLYREPIMASGSYWGLLSTVIDADRILQLLDPLTSDDSLNIALRGADAAGADGAVFVGNATLFEKQDALLDIFVPGGSWQMAMGVTPEAYEIQPLFRGLVLSVLLFLLTAGMLLLRIPLQRGTLRQLERAVSERTESLSRANGLLVSILDSARELAIIATDTSGQITLFNQGAQEMLGYSAEEVVGKVSPLNFHIENEVISQTLRLGLNPADESDRFRMFVISCESGKAELGEWTYQRKDGTRLPVWLIISDIIDHEGKLLGYLGIAQDLTERKRLDKLKDEFMSAVSHELRTPVTSIIGALSLLKHSHRATLPKGALDLLDVAERNGARLQALINDLLDFSKIEAGEMTVHMDSHSLESLLDESLQLTSVQIEAKNLTLELQAPEFPFEVWVDAHRFQQVMANLLSNAIKFSPQGSTIRVTVAKEAHGVKICVIDQGPGIPRGKEQRLFQKFSQLDGSDSRSQGGTGLGLAISRELMRLMGGTIGLDQSHRSGALFWLWLPSKAG